QADRFAPIAAVRSGDERTVKIHEHWIAAGSRAAIGRIDVAPPEGIDRNDDESGGGDHGDREHAAAGTLSGIPQADADDSRPAVSLDRAWRPLQGGGDRAQAGNENRAAGAEEPT